MSEKDIIAKTKSPATIASISKELSNLGIKKGDTLIVHSSLSSIGWVCGGPQAVVEALINLLGIDEGTLVMPAHSGDWSDPANWSNPPVPEEWIPIIKENMPAYNKHTTPTRGMGRIAEVFRSLPGTIRSDNPVVSFCANGKHAKQIIENHPIENHFGIDTPLGKLYKMEAKILLLGVNYENCTSFHLAETMIDDFHKSEKSGSAVMINGQRKWVDFQTIEYSSDDFLKLGKAFEKINPVIHGKTGNAECTLFKMREAVDFAVGWIKENRYFS